MWNSSSETTPPHSAAMAEKTRAIPGSPSTSTWATKTPSESAAPLATSLPSEFCGPTPMVTSALAGNPVATTSTNVPAGPLSGEIESAGSWTWMIRKRSTETIPSWPSAPAVKTRSVPGAPSATTWAANVPSAPAVPVATSSNAAPSAPARMLICAYAPKPDATTSTSVPAGPLSGEIVTAGASLVCTSAASTSVTERSATRPPQAATNRLDATSIPKAIWCRRVLCIALTL